MNKKEIKLSISGDGATFRNFLSKKGASDYFDVNSNVGLYSEEGFKLATEFKPDQAYEPLLKVLDTVAGIDMLKNAGKAVSAVFKASSAGAAADGTGVSWIPWIDNINAFKSSGPMKISITFKFHMGEFGLWDAKEEVFKPIMNLMALFLPANIQGMNIVPHLPTGLQTLFKFVTELSGSGTLVEALGDIGGVFSSFTESSKGADSGGDKLSSIGASLDNLFENISTNLGAVIITSIENTEKGFYSVDIGYGDGSFLLRRMQPLNCTVDFTNKEYDDNGFPIEGKIQMDFVSHQPATVAGIDKSRIDFGFIGGN